LLPDEKLLMYDGTRELPELAADGDGVISLIYSWIDVIRSD
jgi:hypothetical protein